MKIELGAQKNIITTSKRHSVGIRENISDHFKTGKLMLSVLECHSEWGQALIREARGNFSI